jgi:redox-sensitive bicupin YhaK (pirin superfamily)
MMDPRYQEITSSQIPEVTDSGGNRIKIICGQVNGVQGPVRDIVTDPEYLDVTVKPGGTFRHPTPQGHTVLAYVIEGKGDYRQQDPYSYEAEGENYFDLEREPLIGNGHLVHFDDGEAISVAAGQEGVRFLLISGKPIREPIAWYGPIVMNTQQELRVAFDELQRGTFIKSR